MLRLILPFEEQDPQLDTLFFMATRPLKGNPYLTAADSSLGTSAARFAHSFQFCRIVRYGGCPSALSGSVHLSGLPLQSSRDPLPLGQKELLCDSVRQHPRHRDHDSPARRHAYAQPRCARPLDQQHFPYSGNLNYLLPGRIRHHRKILK